MKVEFEKVANLSDRIVNYRAKYNINQGQFANLCGLTKQTINAIETGRKNITKLTFAKINRILDADFD